MVVCIMQMCRKTSTTFLRKLSRLATDSKRLVPEIFSELFWVCASVERLSCTEGFQSTNNTRHNKVFQLNVKLNNHRIEPCQWRSYVSVSQQMPAPCQLRVGHLVQVNLVNCIKSNFVLFGTDMTNEVD